MKSILLQPTDVLFFRDGRPMSGSLAGHGAAWPLPSVINAAFHAALHRAYPISADDVEGERTVHGDHVHCPGRGGAAISDRRAFRFGSLVTAGPFPVKDATDGEGHESNGEWFAPRPRDLQEDCISPSLLPSRITDWRAAGSLPRPLRYAAANRLPPSKESGAKAWLPRSAWKAYLDGAERPCELKGSADDADIFDAESSIGIGIDPETGSQDGERFYSANYLRLREGWKLGTLASGEGKDEDLVSRLLTNESRIVVGGQQRICTARRQGLTPSACLPLGRAIDFPTANGKSLVKWVLLSPSVWPAISANEQGTIRSHQGGWLPNWIDPETGRVLLKAGDTQRQPDEPRPQWRKRVRAFDSIDAKLVSAIVPKPLVVTGWSLGSPLAGGTEARSAGAKSTHLAVPAGAVYYFEAGSEAGARDLATALNWHGTGDGSRILNRRSALMGEKGFGLGVCGTWKFFEDVAGRPVA